MAKVGGLYLPALASLLKEQTSSRSSEDLKHKGICSRGARESRELERLIGALQKGAICLA